MKFAVVVLCGLLAVASALPRIQKKVHPHKIVGGEPAKQGELPYQIQLQLFGSHYCGGSLVVVKNTQVIVSAAHCLDYDASSYTVTAGELDLNSNSGKEQVRNVARKVVHEDYDAWAYSNDIAILFPDSPFDLNDDVNTIDLPQSEQQTPGDVVVSGWGNTQNTGDRTKLQKVQIPVVPDDACQKAYEGDGETIIDSMLCAGLLGEGGKDSCQGDSGGPLRAVTGGYLAGIVSWGYGCAEADYPGVNTEVSYFIDWINNNV